MKRILFLHGVGSSGASLKPLAGALSPTQVPLEFSFPEGLFPFDMGNNGRQWFSVNNVTESNRPKRIAEVMPQFIRMIESLGDPAETLLVGFSQGAIMSLHAAASGLPLAGVVAISGRLAGPVSALTHWPEITLLHGENDPVMPVSVARQTEQWLQQAGARPVVHTFPGVGHTPHATMIPVLDDILQRLTHNR